MSTCSAKCSEHMQSDIIAHRARLLPATKSHKGDKVDAPSFHRRQTIIISFLFCALLLMVDKISCADSDGYQKETDRHAWNDVCSPDCLASDGRKLSADVTFSWHSLNVGLQADEHSSKLLLIFTKKATGLLCSILTQRRSKNSLMQFE